MKREFLHNISWSAIAGFGKFAIAGSTFAIAGHLVKPTEMAQYGLGWSISMLGLLIAQEGAGQALISMPEVSREHYAAANFLTLAFGLLINLAVWLIAGPIAAFYAMPALAPVLKMGAAFVPLMCLSSVDLANLQREMRFRMLATIQLGATALASVSAIGAMILHLDVLGLFLIQGSIGAFAFMLCRFARVPHNYRRFSRRHLVEVFALGKHMALGGITSVVSQNVPQFVLAKFVGTIELGIFTYCLRIIQLAGGQLGSILVTVLYPTLAKVFRDSGNVGALFARMSPFITLFITLPLAVILFSPADFLFYYGGAEWVPGAMVLFWLALMQFLYCLGSGTSAAYKAIGMPSATWIWNIFVAVLNFASVLIGCLVDGQVGGVVALAISGLATPIQVVLLLRRTGNPARRYLFETSVTVGSLALAVGTSALLNQIVTSGQPFAILDIAVRTIVGLSVYSAAILMLLPTVRLELLTIMGQLVGLRTTYLILRRRRSEP